MAEVVDLKLKKRCSPDVPELTYDLAQRYYMINSEYARLKKERDKLNAEIKGYMGGVTNTVVGDIEVKIVPQDKSKMNAEKTIALLKEKGLTKCIQTKEIVNEGELEQALYTGEISQEDLSTCIELNIINTLKVKLVKKENK